MDLKQAKLILEKINRLYDTMTMDDKVDEFEQDLMLAYIKQFYDSFAPEEAIVPKPIKRNKPPSLTETKPSPAPDPTPEPEVINIVEEVPVPPPAAEIPSESNQFAPEVVEVEEEIVPEPSIQAAAPVRQEPAQVKVNPVVPSMDKKIAELFELDHGNDLSERLSLQPIKDLTKAFGINERMLTINELFGQDNSFFEAIIERLNRLPNFDEAKYVLAQVAEKHGWSNADKRKKAIIFIKQIYRRYL